jgi:phospholipase/carboxylesterase
MANVHQWWPIETFSAAERAAGVAGAAPDLDRFLSDELKSHGLADDRLLIVGFSQGAMMALHVGLRRKHPSAGIIGISGMLVDPESMQAEITNRSPVLLIHGTSDDVVPFRSLELAADALSAAAVPVTTHVVRGLGHSVDQDGLAAAAAFASQLLT